MLAEGAQTQCPLDVCCLPGREPALSTDNGQFGLIEPILSPLGNGEERNLRIIAAGFLLFVTLGLSSFLLQWD